MNAPTTLRADPWFTDLPPMVPAHLPDASVGEFIDRQLRLLLSTCFSDPCFASRRYCHKMPGHRWIVPDGRGQLAAHAAAHDLVVGSSSGDIRVLGIAEVCVHPDFRGRGLLGKMVAEIHAWGRARDFTHALLFGLPEVYRSSGYSPIGHPIRRLAGDGTFWENSPMATALWCPLGEDTLPGGEIDLRGPLF